MDSRPTYLGSIPSSPAKRINAYKKHIITLEKAKAYLGGECVVCGKKDGLHFHHKVPELKSFAITQYRGYRWDVLQPELDKCELLCVEHHKEVHATAHGKLRMYNNGCRCDICKGAWNSYMRTWRANKRARISQTS